MSRGTRTYTSDTPALEASGHREAVPVNDRLFSHMHEDVTHEVDIGGGHLGKVLVSHDVLLKHFGQLDKFTVEVMIG